MHHLPIHQSPPGAKLSLSGPLEPLQYSRLYAMFDDEQCGTLYTVTADNVQLFM